MSSQFQCIKPDDFEVLWEGWAAVDKPITVQWLSSLISEVSDRLFFEHEMAKA